MKARSIKQIIYERRREQELCDYCGEPTSIASREEHKRGVICQCDWKMEEFAKLLNKRIPKVKHKSINGFMFGRAKVGESYFSETSASNLTSFANRQNRDIKTQEVFAVYKDKATKEPTTKLLTLVTFLK
jgi:hypothetical protein